MIYIITKVLLKKIKKKLDFFRLWYKKVYSAKTDYKVTYFTKMKYAFKGFTVNEYVWYDLKNNDYRDYISDFERIKSRDINGQYKMILDNKLLFEEVFRNYIRVPKNYGWISNGNIYGLHEYNLSNSNIINFIKEKKAIVLKWESGYEGKGVFVIEYKENNFFINSEISTLEDVNKCVNYNGTAIICEYIRQSQFENDLYPGSNNTIRIVCAKKKNEKYAHIIKAVQRIGTEYCKPVDNVSAGGLACEIDLATGSLGPAVAKYGEMDKRLIPFANHPDTNNPIEGRIIPDWEKIKTDITNLTNKLPYFNFIAWDVSLTDEGPCIIEGNASSGCGMFQLFHGVKNEELGDIYRSYGIIK